MAITRATNLADIGSGIGTNPSQTIDIGSGIQMDGSSTGIITATTFSGTATNAGTAVNLGIGATGYGLVLSGNLTGIAATFTGNVTIGGTLTYDDVTNIDSVGLITARNGLQVLAGITTISGQSNLANVNVSAAASFGGNVSIADSIFHTGDTNTSIRFPAADTFTVETASVEATRVDSSQRLLVGKTSSTNCNIEGIGYDNLVQIEGADVGEGLQVSNDAETARINITWKETESSLSDGDKLGHLSFGAGVTNAVERARIECNAQTTNANGRGGQLTFMTCADGDYIPYERLRIANSGAAIFKGGLAEKYENAATTLGAQTANPLSDGNVILFSGNESGSLTINFTGIHGTTISNGETVSFTVIITPNNSGYIGTVQVDGVAPATAVYWSGGAPTSGGASGRDVYTFQILKIGTGTNAYQIYGAVTNYTNA